jgi:hypothetical protein
MVSQLHALCNHCSYRSVDLSRFSVSGQESAILLLVQVGKGGVLAGEVQLNNPQNRPKAALSVVYPCHGKLYLSCRYGLPLSETRSPSRE